MNASAICSAERHQPLRRAGICSRNWLTFLVAFRVLCLSANAAKDDPLLAADDLSRPVGEDPYFPPRTIGEVLSAYDRQREQAPVERIFAVIIADENAAGIAAAVQKDLTAMKDLLKRGFPGPAIRLCPVKLTDDDLSPRGVVRKIAGLDLGDRDLAAGLLFRTRRDRHDRRTCGHHRHC